jgi:hypothetical protein
MDALKTTDHAEAVAVFRGEVVASLCLASLPTARWWTNCARWPASDSVCQPLCPRRLRPRHLRLRCVAMVHEVATGGMRDLARLSTAAMRKAACKKEPSRRT